MNNRSILLMVEDDQGVLSYGPSLWEAYGLDFFKAETYEQAVDVIADISKKCSWNIITILDWGFPSQENHEAPWLVLLERKIITPDKHLLICNSWNMDINSQMPWLFWDSKRILSDAGKPKAIVEGLRAFKERYT